MDLLYTAHVPAGDGPFATVIALHGWGANAHDLLGLAPLLLDGEALVLCPQGPVALEIGQGMLGYGWFPLAGGAAIDPAAFARGKRALVGWLDAALAAYPVDRRKLVLLGFSQGGFMALDLALREPERFAGLIALSTWMPPALADAVTRTPALASLPTLLVHGSEDPMVPVARAYESRDALLKLGVPVVFREYPMGHEIRPPALRDVVDFLRNKVASPIHLA